MGYMDEYNRLKKKREEEEELKAAKENSKPVENSYLSEYQKLRSAYPTVAEAHVNLYGIGNRFASTEPEASDTRTWFQKGALGDGFTTENFTKTVYASKDDVERNLWTGILGIGESLVDSFAMLGQAQANRWLNETAQGEILLSAITGRAEDADVILSTNAQLRDKMKKSTAEFVAKDLYDEAKIANKIVSGSNYLERKIVGYDTDTDSVFGEKSDALIQSGGQLLTQVGANAILPGSGMALMAATSFGSEAENALRNNATFEEATLSAAISAGAEVLTEKLGGISFGGKTVTDAVFGKMSRHMSSKLTKALITTGKIAADATAEGLEEVVSGYASAIGQQMTYMDDKEIEELFSKEDRLEAFIGGFVLGGAGGGIQATTSKANYVSGLTKNEEAVVNKVYEDELAKRGDLTGKEKTKLYDDIVKRMERGYIDTDTIESVLGGESYKGYQSMLEQEKSLKSELEALENTPEKQFTIKQRERLTEIRKQLEGLDTKTAKSKLFSEVEKLTVNDRLRESYNERIRATEDFKADFEKYKGTKHEDAARKTLENAIKSGASNTNAVHDIVDFAAHISAESGKVVDFKTDEDIVEDFIARQTKVIAQFESIENRTAEQNKHLAELKEQLEKVKSGDLIVDGNITGDTIVLNIGSKDPNKKTTGKPLNRIIGHEVTHSLEQAKSYGNLRDYLFAYAKSKGIDTDAKIAELKLKYEGIEDADPEAELVADLVGDYLFTDKDFVNNLSTSNRNLAQKIYDEIKHLLKMATAGSKEARELERVKYAFENAFREAEQNREANEVGDTETHYAIREAEPPKETGVAYKVFFVKDGKLYPPMVANPDGADTPVGVWLDADVGQSAPPSKTGRQQVKAGGKGTQGGSGSLAFRPGWHLGDLPRASQFDRVNPETGKKELFPENFVWAEVEYAKDVDYQEEAMSYGYTENGKFRHAYAGLPRLPENGYYRYRTNPKPDTVPWIITGSMKVNRLLSDAEVNQILEQNGVAPVHRQGGDVGLDKFGFDTTQYSLSNGIDSDQNLAYNGTRGESYARTDEFRNLQAESQRMPYEDTQSYWSGSRQVDNEVRGRLSRTFGLELRSANSKRIHSIRTLLNPKTNKNVNIVEGVDGSLFHDVFEISRKYLANGELVDLHTVETTEDGIGYNDCYNYLSDDGLSGFSITPDGDLISVFNLNAERGFLKTIAPIVTEKAKTLDCYASQNQNLMVMYEKIFGFKTASVMDYNMEYDHDNIAENHGMPKVAFMVNTDSDVELREFTKDQYDEAFEYRNSFVNQAATNEAASFMPETDDIAPTKYSLSESDQENAQKVIEGLKVRARGSKYLAGYATYTGERMEREIRHSSAEHIPDYAKSYITWVDPIDFIYATTTSEDVRSRLKEEAGALDLEKLKAETQPIHLTVNFETGEIVGHEGRHRMLALQAEGIEKVAVVIDALNDNRHHTKPIEFMQLKGQRFGGYRQGVDMFLHNMLPLSQRYADTARELFTNKPKSGIQYSLSDSNGNELSPAVQNRFAKSKVVDYDGNLKVVYHGTPNGEFTIFDKSKGSVEGDFGSGFYFTDNADDVSRNYEGGGPDFENKVARRAEQIYGEEDVEYSEAEARAREELYVGSNKFEVYLNIENPAVVGETILFEPDSYYEQYNQEDYDSEDDYLGDVEQLIVDDIDNILWDIERNVDVYSTDGISDILWGAFNEGGIDVEGLKKRINNLFLEDSNGNMVGNEVTRQIIESLGYDGIIDNTVSSKFNMHLAEGTTHYIVFKPNQIKNVTNQNPTDNPDINLSLSNKGDGIAPIGNYDFYGKDFRKTSADDIAPVAKTAKPVAKTAPVTAKTEQIVPEAENVAPVDETVKRQEVESVVGDRDGFMSKRATELYEEITSLKKGVRASQRLGYLLDHGYEWRSIKTALLNIRDNPNKVVNPNSAAESVTREMLGREYDAMVEEYANAEGVTKDVFNKMKRLSADLASLKEERDETVANWDHKIAKTQMELDNSVSPTQTELENLKASRQKAIDGYNRTISDKQAALAGKKNTDTKVAHNLKIQIERLTRLRDSTDAEYAKRISQAEQRTKSASLASDKIKARVEKYKRLRDSADARYAESISRLEGRLEKMSKPEYKTAMQRKTKQGEYTKLMEGLVGDTSTWKDKKLGISYKVNTLRRNLRDIVKDSNGNPDIAKADAIYDELQGKYNHNEAELKRESMRIKKVFQDLKLNHAEDTYAHMLGEFRHNPDSKLTEEDVKEYYEKHKGKIDAKKVDKAIEESRKVFDELIVRVNERLREQGMKEIPYRQGYFPHFTNPKQGWLAKLFNWKPVDNEIPTSIAGLTEEFNPQRSWQSFNKQRKGDTTDYSLEQGLDTYIHGALDWIYHIEDIQKRRALENHIRYVHSEEGVKKRIDEIRNNESYDADEAQAQIDAVYAEANNPLNNFVTDLRAGTNTLANKKSSMDRKMEETTNRKIYSVMTNLNNRINANMVVGSFSSALTNFIPITQSWMEVSPVHSLRGMYDTIKSTIRDDGIVSKSDFLTNRLMDEEKLYQTGWDKVSDKAAFMMDAIDSFTSQTVWRSKYLQNISEGMSETQAIKNADQFAENVIAGRSRGNQPTIFDAKNPLTKIFTAFQLEVNNQYGYMFKDAPQDAKNKARLVKGYATAFLGAYAYNALYSSLVGRDAAFDPISILEDLFKDLFGDDEEEPEDILLNLTGNVLEEVPFVGGLLGGGRVPVSSALPYNGDYKTFISDIANGELSAKEMLKPLYYLAMPVAGGQIKKTNEGLAMFSGDHPVSGSYTESGNLRFPVEKTFGNVVQAGMFGQYASKNARDYFDNNRSPLGEKQIQEFVDVDIPIRDYWEYRDGLKGKDTLGEKLAYIDALDLPISKKNILANNQAGRDEPIDMAEWGEYGDLEEYDYAVKYPDKYKFLEAHGISAKEYNDFDDDTKDAYSWAYQNPEKYAVSKAVSDDVVTYRTYTKGIYKLEADKDENGKSINGSRKEKVFYYIDSLPLDYGQKCILFKSEYKSDDSMNRDILEYLDSREDISYEEMVTILTELGFTVKGNNVYWD